MVNDVRIHPIREANLSGRQPSICGKTAAIYWTRLKWLIDFGKDVEKNLLEATSPFVFSTVNERSILRFLKLIACDNGKIGTYAKLVDDRPPQRQHLLQHPGRARRQDHQDPPRRGRDSASKQVTMAEAAELANYLPFSFMSRSDDIHWDKRPKEQEYIESRRRFPLIRCLVIK